MNIVIRKPDSDDILPIHNLIQINSSRGHFLPGRTYHVLQACFTNQYFEGQATVRVAVNDHDPFCPPEFAGFYLLTQSDKSMRGDGRGEGITGAKDAQEIFLMAVEDYFQKKGVGKLLLQDAINQFQETRWAKYLVARTHRGISTRMEYLLTKSNFILFREEEKLNIWGIKK